MISRPHPLYVIYPSNRHLDAKLRDPHRLDGIMTSRRGA